MPAKLTLFPGRGVSRHFVFYEGKNQFVGRDPASEVFLEDSRVSGRHALFQWTGGGWLLVDLRSKNGTYVNGARVSEVPLQNGDWISFGGLLGRHERIGESEVEALAVERTARLSATVDAGRDLEASADGDALWRSLLSTALRLSGGARGFAALFGPPSAGDAVIASGYAAFEPMDERFEEVLEAVASVLKTGEPAVFSRKAVDGGRRRPTVEALGSGAAAAVPILRASRVAGVLVAEGRPSGGAFTQLDLEILQTLSEQASVALEGLATRPRIRELVGARETAASGARSFLEELEGRLMDLVRASRETAPSQSA
ncbi:MAG: FHA domain-containing protein [Acidobacteria bacterium]|nr:FHA domain-containing protein [Acidobacteriota bacterium]MCA1612363.1 FHA domain-containing protein [Acidobacteriota bacterium]